MLATALLATALLAVSAFAQKEAAVTIEASHGGAGNGLTNTTIDVIINKPYHNATILDEVSTLYLRGATGVPLDSITCTPFKNADGSGDSGLPFNSTSPSYVSTNTIQIGSIVCITTHIEMAPPGGLASSSSATPTSTLVTTKTPLARTTVTSEVTSMATETSGSQPIGASSTTSGGAAASTGNAASCIALSGELFGGLALAGFGLAFAL